MGRYLYFTYNFHQRFMGRTVILHNNNVELGMKVLNRIMAYEGFFDIWRRTRAYEKPYLKRRRLSWERCKGIYDEDMNNKIRFVMRTNREDPWLGRGLPG